MRSLLRAAILAVILLLIAPASALAANPATPTNSSPADEAGSQSRTPTLTASAFSDSDPGDTHASSQWQITTVEGNYTSPVWDSGEELTDLTSIVVDTTLDNETRYFWHVRYRDNNTDWSSYSAETSFTPARTHIQAVGSLSFSTGETALLAVFVEDSEGEPVSDSDGATATIDIFSPSQTSLVNDGAMTFLTGSGNVFYYGYVTPATEGVYTFTVTVTYQAQETRGGSTFHVSPALNTIETNLDDSVSSRASTGDITGLETALTAEIDDNEGKIDTIDGIVDAIQSTVSTNLDAAVSTRASSAALTTAEANLTDEIDENEGKLDIIDTILDALSALVTSNLDDTVSSRASSTELAATETALTAEIDENETKLDTIDENVDDIESTANDIQDTVEDIEDTTDDTNTRVRNIQDDINEIQRDLRGITNDIADLDTLIDTTTATIRNEHATMQTSLTNSTSMLTALERALGFKGSSRSVWDHLDDLTKRTNEVLSNLGIQTTTIDRIVRLDTSGTQNLETVLNVLADIRAASETATAVIDNGAETAPSNHITSWFTFGSIIQNFLVVNPTSSEQTVTVRELLPVGISEDNVIDAGGMTIASDEETGRLIATASVTLSPGASRAYRVEMEDVFVIPTERIEALEKQIANVSADTAMARQTKASLTADLADIRTRQSSAVTAEERVEAHANNLTSVAAMQVELDKIAKTGESSTLPFIIVGLGVLMLIIALRRTRGNRPRSNRGNNGYLQTRDEQERWHSFLNQFQR